jgi:anti-anti-sigma factor
MIDSHDASRPAIQEITFARLESNLNGETLAWIREQLSPLLRRPGHVVLDLRNASLDSAGLGALLSMQRMLELQGRRLLVVATDPGFQSLLDVTGARAALNLYADAEQAMASAREIGFALAC